MTNTGERAGTEVVQMYIRDRVSSVTRPIKELKGFKKVRLAPGESTHGRDPRSTPASLAFYDIDMQLTSSSPANFAIMVGTSSRDEDLTTVELRVDGVHTPHS